MRAPSYEFVEHTADIAVRLRAGDAAGLFEAASAAVTDALTDPADVKPAAEREFELAAPDLELLLVDWLHELLFLFETERLLVAESRVHIESGNVQRLRATIRGEPRDESRHPLKRLIKAVTYHGLAIRRTEGGYEATVILDI